MDISKAKEIQNKIRDAADNLNKEIKAAHSLGLKIDVDLEATREIQDKFDLTQVKVNILIRPSEID